MKININIEKRYFFAILAGILVIAGIIVAYATHPVPGGVSHNLGEITGTPSCVGAQALTHDSTGWRCIDVLAPGIPTTCTIILNSTGQAGNYRIAVPIPNSCYGLAGCKLVRDILGGSPLRLQYREFYDYSQDSSANIWLTSGASNKDATPNIFANAGTNGDGTSTTIMGAGGGAGGTVLYDDDCAGSSGGDFECVGNQWYFEDTDGGKSNVIYVCT